MPDTEIHAAAVALGRKGGRSTSPRKQAASRRNVAKATAARKPALVKQPTLFVPKTTEAK